MARGRAGDEDKTREMLDAALTAAHTLDLPRLLDRVLALQERPDEPPAGGPVFRYDDGHWTVTYDGSVLRFRDSRGLRYLARLVSDPATEFGVHDLAAEAFAGAGAQGDGPLPGPGERERARSAVTKRIKDEIKRLAAANRALGSHLAATIYTGHFCRYDPESPKTSSSRAG